ncbi:TraE family protein, partial [Intestinimonas sp. MSJ-38]|nr:TraE family protein [Intestinimonas sp. MSJ-38]
MAVQFSLPWIKPDPERDGFQVPKSAQQSIPIKRIYKDGVFQVAGKFSKTWSFSDINYAVASMERQQQMILAWCTVINMLPTNVTSKISLINHKMDRKEFETTQLMALEGDRLDHYRTEYNDVVEEKARESNDMIREMFITVSVEKKTVEEARAFFQRLEVDLSGGLRQLDSHLQELTLEERLRLFHDFFRPKEQEFSFDLKDYIRKGHDFKDAVAPEC